LALALTVISHKNRTSFSEGSSIIEITPTFQNEERIFKTQMPFPAPGRTKRASANTPPSCTIVQAHFSSGSQRTIDHVRFRRTKMPTSCIQRMSLNMKASIVRFHHRQQRLLSR
jgi:hypothetical protein